MKLEEKYINDFTDQFNKLVFENNLNINTLENLMLKNIENYENELRFQTEKILKNNINENELVAKKNKNGKKKDIN